MVFRHQIEFIWVISFIAFVAVTAKSKYYDGEIRPYEFGYRIEGNQHRHEKKDENGIINGEYGFITGDDVYHSLVYATDEDGNFKIVSFKNQFRIVKSTTTTAPHQIPAAPISRAQKSLQPLKSCSNCKVTEKVIPDTISSTAPEAQTVTVTGDKVPTTYLQKDIPHNSVNRKVENITTLRLNKNNENLPRVKVTSTGGKVDVISPINIALGISSAGIKAAEQMKLKHKESRENNNQRKTANHERPTNNVNPKNIAIDISTDGNKAGEPIKLKHKEIQENSNFKVKTNDERLINSMSPLIALGISTASIKATEQIKLKHTESQENNNQKITASEKAPINNVSPLNIAMGISTVGIKAVEKIQLTSKESQENNIQNVKANNGTPIKSVSSTDFGKGISIAGIKAAEQIELAHKEIQEKNNLKVKANDGTSIRGVSDFATGIFTAGIKVAEYIQSTSKESQENNNQKVKSNDETHMQSVSSKDIAKDISTVGIKAAEQIELTHIESQEKNNLKEKANHEIPIKSVSPKDIAADISSAGIKAAEQIEATYKEIQGNGNLKVNAKGNDGTPIKSVSPKDVAKAAEKIELTESLGNNNLKVKNNNVRPTKASIKAFEQIKLRQKESQENNNQKVKANDVTPIVSPLKIAKDITETRFKTAEQIKLPYKENEQQNNNKKLNEKPSQPDSKQVHLVEVSDIPVSLQTKSNTNVQVSSDDKNPRIGKTLLPSKTHLSSKEAIDKFIGDVLYRFNYTAGYHGHSEEGDSAGNKVGSYFIIGRDNIKRGVIYVANENGFLPMVKYEKVSSAEAPHEDTEKNGGIRGYEFDWLNKGKSEMEDSSIKRNIQ